jgi:hypothetical protein
MYLGQDLHDVHEHLAEAMDALTKSTGWVGGRRRRLFTLARLLSEAQGELTELGRELREAYAVENPAAERE